VPNPAPSVSSRAAEPAPVSVTHSTPNPANPENAVTTVSQDVDVLISRQVSFTDRRALMQKLKEAGKLDQVIAELKQRAENNPDDPGIPTALGVSLMNKFPVPDFNEAARLGLEIDQNFDAALKLDPAHWEAQYEKASSMSFWPDFAGNKGPEIIERLSNLLAQQQTATPQPEFSKTYVLLGRQFQKAGRLEEAQATWQAGLARFPNDPALQKALENAANH